MAGDGGEADLGRHGADVPIDDDDLSSWPGLESLPPEPPVEYPPARVFRRRRSSPDPTDLPAHAATPLGGAAGAPVAPVRRRWPLIAALAAVVLLLLAVPAVWVATRPPETDEALGATTTTSPPTEPTTTEPGATTTDPSTTTSSSTTTSTLPPIAAVPDPPLDAAIAEASVFVTQQRGHDFAGPVPAVRLPDAEFEQRAREHLAVDTSSIEAQEAMLKLQGVIPEDADYVETYLAQYPTMLGAYYDPATKGIVARGEAGTPVPEAQNVLLAHELTHALDDHTFDLSSRVYDDPYAEQWFGLDALNEGDAQRIQNLWAAAHGQAESHPSSKGTDDAIASQFAVTYELGEKLVNDIVARGGEAAVDQSFDDPPTTSEQVMHPEKYAVREPARDLDAPLAEGQPFWEGVTGEYTTAMMLGSAVPADVAERAAAGWGGDKGVLYQQSERDGGLTCLRIAYVADSPEDFLELEDAFAQWVAAAPDRTGVRETPTRLVVTSCADIPPPPPDAGRGGSPL